MSDQDSFVWIHENFMVRCNLPYQWPMLLYMVEESSMVIIYSKSAITTCQVSSRDLEMTDKNVTTAEMQLVG